MKATYIKLAVIGALLFSSAPFAFASGLTVLPTNPSTNSTVLTVDCTTAGGSFSELFDVNGNWITYTGNGSCWNYLSPITLSNLFVDGGFSGGAAVNGVYHFVSSLSNGASCAGGSASYNTCIASGDYGGDDVVVTLGGGGGSPGTFGSSTALALSQGAVSDLSGFLSGVIPKIVLVIVSLLAIGLGIIYLKRYVSGRTF